MSGKQFTLEFKETTLPTKETEKADIKSDFKDDIIVSKCLYNKCGKCYCIACDPEPLACPCAQYVSFNRDAIKRFEETVKLHHAKGKLQMHDKSKLTYYDLWQLAKFRRGDR